MTSEDSFRDRVAEELAGLRPPPLGEVAGEALAHGRRIRRRQRVAGVVGGTAAVAGLAAGVVALSGGFAAGGAGAAPVAPGGAAGAAPTSLSAPVSTPAPSTSSSSALPAIRTPGAPPVPPTSSTSAPNTVIGTIPASWKPPVPGGTLTDPTNTDGQSVAELVLDGLGLTGTGSGSDFSGSSTAGMNANATLTWATHSGSVRISASVSNEGVDGKTPDSVCYPAYETDYCAAGTFSDGSVVMVVHGTGEPPAGSPPTHSRTVMITRPDHTLINVVEWSNGPLTDDQLYKIVSDPRWGLKMDGSFVAHADEVIRPFSG